MKNISQSANAEQAIRNKITVITFLSSILVIYIHTYNLSAYDITWQSPGFAQVVYKVESYIGQITQIAVPAFFFISGLLFYRTFEINRLLQKWKSRLLTIVIPYLIWCTLYYLYYIICSSVPVIHAIAGDVVNVEVSVAAWISHLWPEAYYTLWFLQNLIIFILLAPIIWLCFKNHFNRIPTGLLILAVTEFLIYRCSASITWSEGLDVYLAGAYIGLNCREMLSYRNRWISYIACCILGFMLATDLRYVNIFTEMLIFLSVWFALDLLPFTMKSQPLPWWMSITFFTYVAHDVLLEALEKLFFTFLGNAAIFALLDYLMMPIGVEILLIVIATFLRRYLPHLWMLLTGMR